MIKYGRNEFRPFGESTVHESERLTMTLNDIMNGEVVVTDGNRPEARLTLSYKQFPTLEELSLMAAELVEFSSKAEGMVGQEVFARSFFEAYRSKAAKDPFPGSLILGTVATQLFHSGSVAKGFALSLRRSGQDDIDTRLTRLHNLRVGDLAPLSCALVNHASAIGLLTA